MKKTVKRSLALFLAMVMLMSNVMTSMATEPASGNGTTTEETTAAQTEPAEAEGDETPDPEEEIPGDNTTPEEGETPSNDLTETPAGSEEEPTEATEESSAPAESEPESSEESSAPTEEESTTAAETTAAESEAASSEVASDEETTPEETTEAPKTVYAVSTYCDPKKGGKISISDSEVKEGEDLQFTVRVNEGYVLELVYVNDEEAEASDVNDTETVYHYVVEDVASDIDIEAHFAEAEEEETEEGFEAELSMDGITFIVTADAGVLPEGAKARIISLEEAADIDADAVKEEVLDAEGVTEEEEPLYAAYRIELLDAEGEVLSDEDIKGEVKVSISGLESMSEEEASEPSIYKVEASPVPKDSAANADVFSAPNRAPRLMTLEADTDADAEKDLDVKKIGDKTSMGGATLDVAVLAAPALRADDFIEVEVYLGNNEIEGRAGVGHKWTIVDKDENPTNESLIWLENSSDRTVNVNIDYTCPFGSVFYIKHSYNLFGEREEHFQITVVKGDERAYFYIKKDPTAPDSDSAKDYMYWGTGSVPLGPASENSDVKHEPLEGKPWKDDIEIPKDLSSFGGTNGYDRFGYPILTDGSTSYYSEYSEASEDNSYYTIKWNKFTVASGAVGADGITPLPNTYDVDWFGKKVNKPTWHIDADVTFHDVSKIQIVGSIQEVSSIEGNPRFKVLHNDTYERDIDFESKLSGITEEWKSQYQHDISKAESKGYELNWYIEVNEEREDFDLSKIGYYAAQKNPRIDRIDIVGVYEKKVQDITIFYEAGLGGSVLPESESLNPETGIANGSTATAKDGYAFVNWTNGAGEVVGWEKTYTPEKVEGSYVADTYTANFETSKDGDDIPDKYQVSVTYKVENGKWDDGTADDKTEKVTLLNSAGYYDENAEVALAAIPAVGNEPNTGYEAGSWDPTPGVVGKDDNEAIYTYSYKEKAAVEILYKAGEGGSVTPTSETVNPVSGTAAGSEAVANANYAFVNWTDKEGNVVGWDAKFVPDKENGVYEADEYTANFALDENQDGIPDEEQKDHVVTLQPYQTSIYFGGNNDNGENNGLPNLEIEVVELDRALISSNINTVTINGHKFSEAETNKSLETFFKPLYVYSGEGGYYHQVNNDTEALGHDVKTVIAVLDSALAAFEGRGDYVAKDGFVYNNTTNRYVTINSYNPGRADVNSFGINAKDENGQPVDYFVKVASGNLIVREVTNDAETVIREVVDTGEQAVAINAADDQAAAVPGEGAVQFLTNGDDKREQADPDDVKLLVDDVKDTDNRRTLLADKAFTDAYGMTAAEAKAQGYDSELKFLDLVDTQNGNAWVKSITGTYVYWPYPDGTDKNTEFKLVHFEGLDRERDYNGADAVANAIADAPIKDHEDLLMEKTDEGIKFFTSGDLAFSPFMLMWDTDSNQSGTDTPSTGGGTSSTPTGSGDATPSGPVSVQQSGNSKGYYYTAGLHGNWVHMDNVDMNTPLDEPVPAGATAVDFPEWHRWRFYLSSGVMLDNQWAHIENPYAVGDQPRSGWFYFDHDGLMRYGWYLDTRSGDWYYMHSESDGMLGTMMTGWHYDSHDNRWYYLDPQSGAMKTGWQQIGGKWYYFNPTPFGETWTLDHSSSVWRFNGNTVRPYGSMYQNEVTPDGYKVGEDGAWIQ